MAEGTETVKLSLRLLIDEESNKVVLAESGKDFVDVLFSFLTLPMGTIVRLLEKHRTSPQVVVGCFNNLYKSVSEMGLESFQTEACKQVLLYPRSLNLDKYGKIKLKIDDTEAVKYFVCPRFRHGGESCKRYYSISSTETCGYGEIVNSEFVRGLMNEEIRGLEEEQVQGSSSDEIFVSCEKSFVITDDLKVAWSSMDYVLNTLRGLGYANAHKLGEIVLDVGLSEVLSLLGCLFTSDTPLTCAFLKKRHCMTKTHKLLSPPVPKTGNVEPKNGISVKVFLRKFDREILYAECNEDFIDSLLTFLILPLELACSLSNDNTILGCAGNLCRSPCRRASASIRLFSYYYTCSNEILLYNVSRVEPTYECLVSRYCCHTSSCKFARQIKSSLVTKGGKIVNVYPIDPKPKSLSSPRYGTGFMKKNTKFIVSNDLIITPMNSSSTIGLLKKMEVDISDLEEHQISISKAELINILRASLISSSALTNGLSSLLVKKPKEET